MYLLMYSYITFHSSSFVNGYPLTKKGEEMAVDVVVPTLRQSAMNYVNQHILLYFVLSFSSAVLHSAAFYFSPVFPYLFPITLHMQPHSKPSLKKITSCQQFLRRYLNHFDSRERYNKMENGWEVKMKTVERFNEMEEELEMYRVIEKYRLQLNLQLTSCPKMVDTHYCIVVTLNLKTFNWISLLFYLTSQLLNSCMQSAF